MGLFNRIIHMETLTGGMVLAGSSTHWKGGHAGVFFDTMMDSDVCNPIIMLDELDKVSLDTVQSPFAPLYSVLEPSTSADFKDEAIPCKLDMSRVNWMATANKPLDIIRNELGDALLSRFTVFNIPEPSVDEKRVIIQSMYARYIQDKNIQHIMEPTLNTDIVDTMLQGSLREAYKQIEDGCGNALAKVYKSLDKMNHKIHITHADTSTHTRHAQRLKVGFHR